MMLYLWMMVQYNLKRHVYLLMGLTSQTGGLAAGEREFSLSCQPLERGYERLIDILELADEYQTEQVLSDCEQYMGTQIHLLGQRLSEDQMMLYLWMMAQYNLKLHLEVLMDLSSKKAVHRLLKSKYFNSVPPETMKELLVRRCKDLEKTFSRTND
ncbi:hypothetical protein C0Q70_16631 [Pomacea canaliculata]|uniref:Uncharacterized protein n=1 Tax=Pomacea canaliculata TaxID=400727 RepID=A0A2T7NQE2_POMCA|nr:hypothetical protein C0Q70_16631 [Pomacea canaliculata]